MNRRPTCNDFVLLSCKHHHLNGALDFDFNPSSEVYKILVSILKDTDGVSIPCKTLVTQLNCEVL